MKNKILFYALLGLVTLVGNAQSEYPKSQIEKGVTELYEAMVTQNKTKLDKLTMTDLTYGHSSGTIENKKEYIEAIMTGSFDFSSIIPEDHSVIISGDTGISRHLFVAKGTNNGEPADVRIGVMMTWQKIKNKWLLLARQAYKL
ncbi:nuclear transport factor 2 family protein [Pseudozobellia sp. WGM2]|uniref:nuclear transport factor 2 family protein n=1 Tax=Pseudozobellia sp. WGM2 TaxID=2787625 RepID=UPI001ADF558B|nr:nuclear transport factor 2 family protein [Pseudozobellia sp. WGM2]